MEFRPCIDIHNGQVKQIVGGSLKDRNDEAKENFVAKKGADYYAELYAAHHIKGGHIILLNPASSEYYEATRKQALRALETYPQGLQIGGGIHAENATEYLDAGASHVIVTSYLFKDGRINMDNLEKIYREVGKEHLVLDLSCRKRDDKYYIVTDRWQKYTDEVVKILSGDYKILLEKINKQMYDEAEKLNFETAAYLKDLAGCVADLYEKQKIDNSDMNERDIIASAGDGRLACIQIFYVREGKIIKSDTRYMTKAETDSDADSLSSFIQQYYTSGIYIPREIILSEEIAEEPKPQ